MLRIFLPFIFMKNDSWLYSDSFLRRALAIYGYSLVGGMIVGVPIGIVMVVIGAVIGSNVQMAP